MKKIFLSMALFAGLFASVPAANAAVSPPVKVATSVRIGYPRPFYATVSETVVIGYRTVIDQWGRVVTVPVYGVQLRTVLVQYDRLTNSYFYYNAYGQAVPYYGAVPRW